MKTIRRYRPRNTETTQDLGFGSRVTEQSRTRFLNRDGSFNVARHGLPFFRSLSIYHALLTMGWFRFFLLTIAAYLATNLLFAGGYFLCGPDALSGSGSSSGLDRFFDAFFFSVQTLATIGYGRLSPHGFATNLIVSAEALAGLFGFALATGLLFARFSRPEAKVMFSRHAIIAPYRGITAFEFRIVNERTNQLIEVTPQVILSRMEEMDGMRIRRFHTLTLERQKVTFMPLHWVVVHPIDESSPLFGATAEDLAASDAEFTILLAAIDETFSQTVHTRTSYKFDEVIFGAKFRDMFLPSDDGIMRVDIRRLHDVELTAIS